MSLFTRSLVKCLSQEPLDELVKIDDEPTYVIGIPAVQQKVNKRCDHEKPRKLPGGTESG